ncbi:MAG: histidine--tRNA ligase [Candidatus Lokiarchaeota archaeon]|nr:histidine--tRNA ligase [Candidatus Lokiarchaeota archaeon]
MIEMNLNPAEGFRDFIPEEYFEREYLINKIQAIFKKYGYQPIDTPIVERKEILEGKSGDETDNLIFRILKRGKKLDDSLKKSSKFPEVLSDLALRYDLTVPLARFYANNKNSLPKIFKRYHIAPVWRAERSQVGRYREFYQCDVDVIGSKSPHIEVEVMLLVTEILSELGFKDFSVRINDRRLLKALLLSVKIPVKLHEKVLITIDKLDKLGLNGMIEELKSRGLENELIENLIEKIRILKEETDPIKSVNLARDLLLSYVEVDKVPYETDIEDELEPEIIKNRAEEVFINLEKIISSILKIGMENGNIEFDPFLVRGMAYYTGPIFEISHPSVSFSIAGGGRFDKLIGILTGHEIPACGFSIGFERILYLMKKNKMFPEDLGKIDIFIPLFSEEFYIPAVKLANFFRAHALQVEIYPEAIKINKQLKIANKKQVPFVIFLGEDEIKKNEIHVKNMVTGEEKRFIKKALSVQYILDNIRRFQL